MVDGVGDRRHDAILHQDFDQVDGAALHQRRQVAHGDGLVDDHFLGQRRLHRFLGRAVVPLFIGARRLAGRLRRDRAFEFKFGGRWPSTAFVPTARTPAAAWSLPARSLPAPVLLSTGA
jgi:hypothetical protein